MKKKPTADDFSCKQYKHDRAMLEAIKRCGTFPIPISTISKVKIFPNGEAK